MRKQVNNVLLVDSCLADNYLHAININAETVLEELVIRENPCELTDYLLATLYTDQFPDIICLDMQEPGPS